MINCRLITICVLLSATSVESQTMPDKCVALPSRTQVCPHLIYKKSPVNVAMTNTKQGEIVCVCLADFVNLRLPAESKLAKIEQKAELSRSAKALKMAPKDLLKLIRD